MVETLNKVSFSSISIASLLLTYGSQEMSSIDNTMRAKLTNYNLVKGSLVQMQRKKTYERLQSLSAAIHINLGFLAGIFLCDHWQMQSRRKILFKILSILKLCQLQSRSLYSVRIDIRLILAVTRNLVKDWNAKYERLASMVVPRSARYVFPISCLCLAPNVCLRSVASDDEYTLFSIVIFRRVHDEFAQQCRENKCVNQSHLLLPLIDMSQDS